MPKLTLLLLSAAALAACTPMSPSPAPASTTAAAPATFMAGTYTTNIVAGDIPAGAPDDMRTGLVGMWSVAMDGNGQLAASYNGQQVVTGTYQVSGNEITFGADDSGTYACHTAGHYTWRASGGQVFFTRVDDTCAGRALALTAHPWTMQH
jgi:hypothetical protein